MAEERSTSSPQQPRHRGSLRYSNPDVFSDDYALDPLQLADNHQSNPADRDANHDVASLSSVSETPRRSLSFQRTPDGSFRRSRGSQRSDRHNSITSRFDDVGSQASRPPRSVASSSDLSNSLSTQHRSIRSISTFGFSRAQSPYQGATGPSHPYGMYPQDIGVARTPSIATTSTIRQPERSYSGPHGPTQPYGMYPQNTVPEDGQDVVAGMPLPIGAGFPGLQGQNFQRRLGPDGEDVDDLIGPDGYAEQLPPYSRYANGVPPKYSSGIGSIRRSTAVSIPAEDSQETLNSAGSPVRTRGDTGAVNPFGDSATELDSTTTAVAELPRDEGGNFKERVREKGKRRVCCGFLPCWLLGLILMALVLAVFLGGIIGGVLAHKHGVEKGREEAPSTVTVPAASSAAPTSTINTSNAPDAVPLTSTPSSLPPLPTGSFAVALDNLSPSSSNSCLPGTDNQGIAWDCATGANLSIDIAMVKNPPFPQITVSNLNDLIGPICFGAQPPELDGSSPLSLMENRENSNKGPAFVFAQEYNKTVILREHELPDGYPSKRAKRSLLERWFFNSEELEHTSLLKRGSNQWTSAEFAGPADKPWYCFWNGTILEGFIFVTQNAGHSDSDDPVAAPSAAATSAASPSLFAGSYQTPGSRAKRQTLPTPPAFSKMVKIIERRNVNNAVPPYCQQMQILNTGQPAPLLHPTTGDYIIFNLTETEQPMQHQVQDVAAETGYAHSIPTSGLNGQGRRRSYNNNKRSNSMCQCVWMADG